MEKQVNKNFYNFWKYCDLDRWSSYWHQIKEILSLDPKDVLEIGVGEKVLSSYLTNNTEINYKSVDIADDLKPDIVASLDKLPLEDNSFDVVCAFEVLEHLPFEKFVNSLNELKRVSRSYVILSLPHWGRHFSISFRLPFFKKIKFQFKFSIRQPNHLFNGQHYWEIGKKGYNLSKIKNEIKKTDMKVIKDYVCFESPYHHFFVLKKYEF